MISDLTARRATEAPENTALHSPDGWSLSWAQLDRCVSQAAGGIAEFSDGGVGKRVAILLTAGTDAMAAILATLRAGAEPILVCPGLWPRDTTVALDAAEPDLILADRSTLDRAGARLVLEIPSAKGERDLLAPIRGPEQRIPDSDPDLVAFTAGSATEPTLCRPPGLRRAGHEASLGLTAIGLHPCDITALAVAIGAWNDGGQIVISDAPDAKALDALLAVEPDRLWSTGPRLERYARHERPVGLPQIHSTLGFLSAAAVELLEAPVIVHYSVTELGGTVSSTDAGSTFVPRDVGHPTEGCGLRVEADESIVVTVDGIDHPTGDLGHIDPDTGALHLLGRTSDRYEVDGEPIDPAVLELALAAHDGIAEVAVVPRPDPVLGSISVAITAPADRRAPPFLEDLDAMAPAEIAEVARPRAQWVTDGLPLTGRGQVFRRLLVYEEASRGPRKMMNSDGK